MILIIKLMKIDVKFQQKVISIHARTCIHVIRTTFNKTYNVNTTLIDVIRTTFNKTYNVNITLIHVIRTTFNKMYNVNITLIHVTCVNVRVLLHVGLLMKTLAAVLTRIGAGVAVDEQVGGERRRTLEPFAAEVALEAAVLAVGGDAVLVEADGVGERLRRAEIAVHGDDAGDGGGRAPRISGVSFADGDGGSAAAAEKRTFRGDGDGGCDAGVGGRRRRPVRRRQLRRGRG